MATNAGAKIDWPAVYTEALEILRQYLRIQSVNPPGNEAPAARFLGAIIEAAGVSCEYIETAPNREAVVARLPGDGSKGSLMLCNHLDVVPVEAQFWTVPPFEGLVQDGFVYGRGAVDMKGPGVMQLMAFLLLARRKTPLAREIVFCGVPDEEAGSAFGMEWLCEHRPDVVDVAFEISEGGMGLGQFMGKDARIIPVATSEKSVCWLRLRAVGKPGHGSRPHRDNSAVHLARAIVRLTDWERPVQVSQMTGEYVRRLAAAGYLPEGDPAQILPGIVDEHPALKAMFINTLNVTTLKAGTKVNVIPALSEATLDCRLLPGEDAEAWRQQVIDRIDDPRIEVLFENYQGDTGQCEWDTELFAVIQQVVQEAMEDAVVLPAMTVGGTDNRFLRERGIPAYGFIPVLLSADEAAGFHGNNEK
ncbi:MAG: M20/M25/M40 family metallo-hydrolase, partial [Dehalococcoidia bacterium]